MPKKFIIGIVFFSLVIVAGSYLLLASGNKPQAPIISYAVSDKERPNVAVKETSADLGTLKVSDEKAKEFIIKNIGKKPLQLSNITTSCGCTAVQIIYQEKISAEFSMHAQSDYVAEIAPQTAARVRVIYRPYVMPVYGVVEREAYISTNDPVNPKLIFKVKSYVK
ncbi:hypothetical protein A3H86_04230 [Candidatus Roizmanbacteria bacterium RIFCSPLOWO2_02_FULL_41_9]|uniref:DUF1573 domain-containing protein n=1 Tax=Candidatus Roizmanbacteria bacterium RIFCSPLOWO2_02_FULL_41_9 TaxID=1802077 RepID=A0A1F7JS57_9BACT|nr:MAG: hypothetical protein A3H86_04230 [Candidatus Roizmanbacteria bacterium RIFCSPLOWO2_02_FULL_41_9]